MTGDVGGSIPGGSGSGAIIPTGGDEQIDEFFEMSKFLEGDVDAAELLESDGVSKKEEDKATKDAKKLAKTAKEESALLDKETDAATQKFGHDNQRMERFEQAAKNLQELTRALGNQLTGAGRRLQFMAQMGVITLDGKMGSAQMPAQMPPSMKGGASISVPIDTPALQAPLVRENGENIDLADALNKANPETAKWFKSTFLMAFWDAMVLVNSMMSKIRGMNSKLMLRMMEARYSSAKSEQAFMLAAAELERKMAIMEFAGKIIQGTMSIAGGVAGLAGGGALAKRNQKQQQKAADTDVAKQQARLDARKNPGNEIGEGGTVPPGVNDKNKKTYNKELRKEQLRIEKETRKGDTLKQEVDNAQAEFATNNTPANEKKLNDAQAALSDHKSKTSGRTKETANKLNEAKMNQRELNPKMNDKPTQLVNEDGSPGQEIPPETPKEFENRRAQLRKNQAELRTNYMRSLPQVFGGFGTLGSSLGDLGKILWVVDKTRWEGMAKIDGLMTSAWGELIGALRAEEQDIDKLIDLVTQGVEKAGEAMTNAVRMNI